MKKIIFILLLFLMPISVNAAVIGTNEAKSCKTLRNSYLTAKNNQAKKQKTYNNAKKAYDSAKKKYNKKKTKSNKNAYTKKQKELTTAKNNLTKANNTLTKAKKVYLAKANSIFKASHFEEISYNTYKGGVVGDHKFMSTTDIGSGETYGYELVYKDLWLTDYFPAKFNWTLPNKTSLLKIISRGEEVKIACAKTNNVKKETLKCTVTVDGMTIGTKTVTINCLPEEKMLANRFQKAELFHTSYGYDYSIQSNSSGELELLDSCYSEPIEGTYTWTSLSNLLTVTSQNGNKVKLSCKKFYNKEGTSETEYRNEKLKCTLKKNGKVIGERTFLVPCQSSLQIILR